jgi:hypothetical protein
MIDPARIARMRKLLQEAPSAPATNAIATRVFHYNHFNEDPICTAIRRRSIVMQIGLATKHYDLKHDVDAFVAAAGQYSLSGLTTPQLDTLATFIAGAMDRASTACDHPDDPPAR